eukprot:9935877-Alexandrium_andersonii.AAC.1
MTSSCATAVRLKYLSRKSAQSIQRRPSQRVADCGEAARKPRLCAGVKVSHSCGSVFQSPATRCE